MFSKSDFQKEIHNPIDMAEDYCSTFYRPFVKATWYSSIPMKLKCSEDGEEIIYTVNNTFHYLIYTYLRFVLPTIKVKTEFKGL